MTSTLVSLQWTINAYGIAVAACITVAPDRVGDETCAADVPVAA